MLKSNEAPFLDTHQKAAHLGGMLSTHERVMTGASHVQFFWCVLDVGACIF